jgi:hypothetical protein
MERDRKRGSKTDHRSFGSVRRWGQTAGEKQGNSQRERERERERERDERGRVGDGRMGENAALRAL